MTVGILDDEEVCIRQTYESWLRLEHELGIQSEIVVFHTAQELYDYENSIDILFLDIEMGEQSGIDVMRQIECRDSIKTLFFVTSHVEFVFDSFGKKTRGFLPKPIVFERFRAEVKRVIEQEDTQEFVEIFSNGAKELLPVKTIVFLKSEGSYLRFVTENGEYLICGKMSEWEKKIEKLPFRRIHKSYMVNFQYVEKIRDQVYFYGDYAPLPVGRKYKEECTQSFKTYLMQKFRERFGDR